MTHIPVSDALKAAWADLLSVFYPDVCHICGGRLAGGERHVCAFCLSRLPHTHYHRVASGNPMLARFVACSNVDAAAALFFYSRESPLSRVVQNFKYNHFPSLAFFMGERMGSELFTTGFFADVSLILPVPLHIFRRMRRGYNQAERIAAGVSAVTGIPLSRSLYARRSHATQTGLTLSQRQGNTSGVFAVRHPEALAGRHVLLVDDVCTTGSTLLAASQALAAAVPGIRITILTLAVTR